MEDEHYELLLAMMRHLKHEDLSGSTLEKSIVSLIDYFEGSFDEMQRAAMSKKFVRYERLLQKRKREEAGARRVKEEEYRSLLANFVFEEAE